MKWNASNDRKRNALPVKLIEYILWQLMQQQFVHRVVTYLAPHVDDMKMKLN